MTLYFLIVTKHLVARNTLLIILSYYRYRILPNFDKNFDVQGKNTKKYWIGLYCLIKQCDKYRTKRRQFQAFT